MQDLQYIPLADIVESTLPLRIVRKNTVEFRELVDSIKDIGIIQPLLVRPRGDKFEVVEGGHRRAAARELGLDQLPCLVRELSDQQVLSFQLQAQAIRPTMQKIEYAERLHHIMKAKQLTLPQMSAMLHKSTKWLSQQLSLRRLSREAKEMVNRGEISVKAAAALARLPNKMQKDYTLQAVTLTAAEFVEEVRVALKNFREYVKTGRTEMNQLRLAEPMPWLRQMRELRLEARTCENAGTVIKRMGGVTSVDGWRACLAWLLHLDPESIERQFEKQEKARHEKLTAAEKRQKDRQLRDHLIQIKDFKNEQ